MNSLGDKRMLVASQRPFASTISTVVKASYDSALNDILLLGATVGFVGATASFTLIRQRDFVAPAAYSVPGS